jgi:hypothetical protein
MAMIWMLQKAGRVVLARLSKRAIDPSSLRRCSASSLCSLRATNRGRITVEGARGCNPPFNSEAQYAGSSTAPSAFARRSLDVSQLGSRPHPGPEGDPQPFKTHIFIHFAPSRPRFRTTSRTTPFWPSRKRRFRRLTFLLLTSLSLVQSHNLTNIVVNCVFLRQRSPTLHLNCPLRSTPSLCSLFTQPPRRPPCVPHSML